MSEIGQPPNLTVTTGTISLSGSLHGSALSISFEDAPATFGTIAGNGNFTLNLPQHDGTLAPVAFHKATTTAFNAAVEDLNASISSANAQQAQANQRTAAAQAQASHQQSEQKAIESDVSTVGADVNSLAQREDALKLSVQRVGSGSLAGTSSDLAEVLTGDQNVVAEAKQNPDGNYGAVCADAGGVAADAGGVAAAAGGVEADADGVVNDIGSLRSAVSGLTNDFTSIRLTKERSPASSRQVRPARVR